MAVHYRYLFTLFLAAFLPLTLLAELNFGDDEEEEGEADAYKIILCTKDTNIPADAKPIVKEKLKKLPDGYKVRIELSSIFLASQPQGRSYIKSCVPVNAAGKRDGVEDIRVRRWWPMNIVQTIPWKNGVKHGQEVSYGESNKFKPYKRQVKQWVNGKVQGDVLTYNMAGNVIAKTVYEDDVPHGPFKEWYDSGKVMRSGEMKQGKRVGTVTDFWEKTGKPKRVLLYNAAGQLDGVTKEFYQNNKLKKELPFVKDNMHGIEKQWTDDGQPSVTRYWLNGELVKKAGFERKFK